MKRSVGLLLFRRRPSLEMLLVHPGGPYWARKDEGAWSVPKGEYEPGEEVLAVACREFREETGSDPPEGQLLELGDAVQPSRKIVTVFAVEGDLDPATIRSNTVSIEWPPRSGRRQDVPEIDRAAWFAPDAARAKLLRGQVTFVDRLEVALGSGIEG